MISHILDEEQFIVPCGDYGLVWPQSPILAALKHHEDGFLRTSLEGAWNNMARRISSTLTKVVNLPVLPLHKS